MNNKMICICSFIQDALLDEDAYEPGYIEYLFANDYPVDFDDITDAIMVELIKYAFNKSEENHPLQHFLDKDDELMYECERMKHSRLIKYIQKYRDLEYKRLIKLGLDPKKLSDLQAKSMEDMLEKLEGHEITDMNFFEAENIHDLKIIKSIVERRIVSTKKISNNEFIEMCDEYDAWVERLIERSKKSAEDMVFCSLAFFTFEWKFAFETLYLIADIMAEKDVKEIDPLTLIGLCAFLVIPSSLGYRVSANSRMVKERQWLIPELVVDGEISFMSELWALRENFVEKVALAADFKEGIVNKKTGKNFRDTFIETTSMEDWASFLEDYNVFEAYHKKEWTNKKIRNMRQLYDIILEPKTTE